MDEKSTTPPFFSMDFHVKFFPALLCHFLQPQNRKYESTVAGHGSRFSWLGNRICISFIIRPKVHSIHNFFLTRKENMAMLYLIYNKKDTRIPRHTLFERNARLPGD